MITSHPKPSSLLKKIFIVYLAFSIIAIIYGAIYGSKKPNEPTCTAQQSLPPDSRVIVTEPVKASDGLPVCMTCGTYSKEAQKRAEFLGQSLTLAVRSQQNDAPLTLDQGLMIEGIMGSYAEAYDKANPPQ